MQPKALSTRLVSTFKYDFMIRVKTAQTVQLLQLNFQSALSNILFASDSFAEPASVAGADSTVMVVVLCIVAIVAALIILALAVFFFCKRKQVQASYL